MQFIRKYSSPLGGITLSSDGEKLSGLWFDGQKYEELYIKEGRNSKNLEIFDETSRWLDIYFSGKNPGFTPEITFSGSDFQREVWELLRVIPYGKTVSYVEISDIIARRRGIAKMSAQAVGNAVGKNKISIIVPCHRVIGTNGGLTGYAGGLDKKLALLKLEGVILKEK